MDDLVDVTIEPQGVLARLADRLGQAVHVGVAGPVEIRQLALVVQRVSARIVRAFAEIDAPHVFAPTDDLADEALNRIERGMAIKRISSVGLELVEDAPASLYRSTATSTSTTLQPTTTQTIQTTPVTTSAYTTTRITQTQVYTPQGEGGWIGRGEDRIWVPADSQ